MPTRKGRDLLLRVSTGASPESFNTISGLRTKRMVVNNQPVDVTTGDEAPWRTLMADAGLRSVTITASGVHKDDQGEKDMERIASTGALETFRLEFGNGDVMQGDFQVASYERAGGSLEEEGFSVTLESASRIDFTGFGA